MSKAFDKLSALNKWLEDQGVDGEVDFGPPIKAAAIAKAEKGLGVRLPPSYVDFVTTHGTFTISGNLTGCGEGNDSELFEPERIVKETKNYRKEFKDDASDDQKIANDGLFFASDPNDERYFVFVISSAEANGEMKARYYDYQDPANTDGWFEGNCTFDDVIDQLIETVKDNSQQDE